MDLLDVFLLLSALAGVFVLGGLFGDWFESREAREARDRNQARPWDF